MKDPTLAAAYCCLYPTLAMAANSVGYALAIHGSLRRDLDLIAVPWTTEAVDAETCLQTIMKAGDGYLETHCGRWKTDHFEVVDGRLPTIKPHGRLAWSIHLGGGPYIDLSIMPLTTSDDGT